MQDPELRQMSEEILAAIREWRRANPRASYVQIEEEVHKRLMQLEARVIESAMQESPSREWGRGAGGEAPVCPSCGIALQARGKHQRKLVGNGGEEVELLRMYGTCPKCGKGLFPPG